MRIHVQTNDITPRPAEASKHFWELLQRSLNVHTSQSHEKTQTANMSAQRPIYVSPNPETTKRDAFTEFFLERPCPQEADPKYKHLFDVHQNLMRMLINDSAMDANRQQTFSTPANSKNKVYFM